MLVVGATASALNGRLPAIAVAASCGLVVATTCVVSDALAAPLVAVIGWMTATAFERAPFGQLRPVGHASSTAALLVGLSALFGALVGIAGRAVASSPAGATLDAVTGLAGFASAVDRRRRGYGVLLAVVLLPSLTAMLTALRPHLSLADDLLIYLIAVVAVAVVGGFWPAIAAAATAGLLLNWFFTQPLHTFTIQEPDNLLALLLFVVVAISVSSVVHLAARRSQQAARSATEAEMLSRLARTVLAGDDSATAVLGHLHDTLGVGAALLERSGRRWVTVASAGCVDGDTSRRVVVRSDLALVLYGEVAPDSARLIEAAAGQAAAALDRERLRNQAAQAEALAAGNRMRTALLAAVSHDLRTPLASIKASISSLRQSDVSWSPEDESAFLETIEESTDRLDSLIANLLDMSRVQTGALQPYLQPAAVDEIAPLALHGMPGSSSVRLDIPEELPLVLTDPGLLERALANLVSNALRFSPRDRPAELVARCSDGRVEIVVRDHGPGVAPADRERIFEPFQRLGDQSASTGVGLGLAVARGFVESVGGGITASETPGGGLTMAISLPSAPVPTGSRAVER